MTDNIEHEERERGEEEAEAEEDEDEEEDNEQVFTTPQIPGFMINDLPGNGVDATYLGHVVKRRKVLTDQAFSEIAVTNSSLGKMALFEHKVASKLTGHSSRPGWVAGLLVDLREIIYEAIEDASMQTAAQMKNATCVNDDYPIVPVPIIRPKNGVAAGQVPPEFPETRGALKAMSVVQLRALAKYYRPGAHNEAKAEVMKRLCERFGIPYC